ncbi:hypothetical protein F0L68_09205 [Solihabitans fulvus]|uniref:Uncharacterized protein n=1 Tax=Solihabitans fulvus TaxID=1892852 RepID=A0A5B2XKK3_9PSEU|nr:hypothetical protein [Solihabitans fulvus]KAA2263836.1 hypothetical protein F0L68_09205 [Solihabitans fulvus]
MAQPPGFAPEPAPGADVNDVAEPGREEATGPTPLAGRRVQRTVNFSQDILERARAAATYLAAYEPSAGVRSLADIVNPAVADRVTELEREFNGGKPFRPVYRMPPGRPSQAAR